MTINFKVMKKYSTLLLSVVIICAMAACHMHTKIDPNKDTLIRMQTKKTPLNKTLKHKDGP